ncbi:MULTISPECIES: sensor histidine kinase [Erythrobacter]|uniref:histidine kinase n=1 Tax=Erythrobacter aureus TaxID=2182384 RepID=A0A345YEP8_9SPHN|nr:MULTISPECIES: PAS domain-containing sensor histidine kinase [Erythrobacter]AXK42400.1 histidine kinase [Erythrobacter aureus]MCF8881089.1 PAS-domain containing protein [Erythrobacter sp. SN021]
MESSPALSALLGLLLALWTAGAVWVMLRASGREQKSLASRKLALRLSRLIEEGPAIPLLVRADGRIEAPDRLARWIGLDKVPDYLSELSGPDGRGLTEQQIDDLTRNVRRTQRTARPFRMEVAVVPGSGKSLAMHGSLADPAVSPGGAALVWVFDFSDSEAELAQLREEAARAREDFGALVGLIEAAPMPMWFRGADMLLRLVNKAYVSAVGAESADQVVADQIELVETVNGRTAAQVAQQAADRRQPIERILSATIDNARRTIRVTDLPLMGEGIAGYAVDIEEMEEQAREFRAFREAQRSMLDQLSIGVAQFDAAHRMTFANQPFHRVFALPPGVVNERTTFQQMLLIARENGRIPEVRDFPAWRNELAEWFLRDEPHEEAWPLPDSTHLRIIAQPLPDGGLVMIAEDRTEQLALSATRDTLLRTRTATFDNLFEALAVFAPDGHLELWNRGFPGAWGIDPEVLDGHPQAEDLLEAIAKNLADPAAVSRINQVIRAATLDRKKSDDRIELSDGRTLDFAGVPLPDGNGLLTVLDVTASRQAEEALRERNRALEEADAVMTRFLANMSYEFRTPLTSIGGFAELLTSGIAGELTPQAKEYAQAISLSVGKLTEQVENVLDLSQSEAGLMPLRKTELELLPFITQIVRKQEGRILDGELTLDLKGNPDKSVTADPQQLRRAISQLLDNAIKGTPRGGRIVVDIGRKRGETKIIISDNGRGMSQHELARALEGIRMAPGGKGIERRQGLGIPLARQLIEAHDGTLDIQSRKNGGTTATITLP